MSFDYLVVSIGLPTVLPAEDIVRLESKICSLSEQMFYEIAVDANQFIEQSLIGKEQVTRNVVRPIKRMRDKLDGLGFLDYRVAPVVSTIDDLLSRIPTKGAIEGIILQEIFATALLLADPDKTKRHGAGLLTTHSLAIELDEGVDDGSEAVQVLPASQPETIEAVQHKDQFSELFAGIFEEELEFEDDLADGDIEMVTTEDIDYEGESETDRWF